MIYDLISHLIHSLFSEVAKKVDAKTEEKELNAKTKLAAKKVDAKTEEKELNAKTKLARLFKVCKSKMLYR